MDTTEHQNPYSAVDPTLGYLYQIRSALLWTLQKSKTDPDFLVSIETLDDVSFETTGGSPLELIQTKHHRNRLGNLTDASSDLWKTIRIWADGMGHRGIPREAKLCLVTTGIAPAGTAASRLRSTERDVQAAKAALDTIASTSSNQTNALGYSKYLELSQAERTNLLEKMLVIDASPRVAELDAVLMSEIRWAAGKEQLSAFLTRLEGWWFRRVLKQLSGPSTDRISAIELESEMDDLREQFKADNLPIDDDLLAFTLDDATVSAHEESIFVHQLEIAKASKSRIAFAVRDYYRAFEQRSRWLRDHLVAGKDLQKYEKRLTEEWEITFEAVRNELGDDVTEEKKARAARSVLEWAEKSVFPIRPAVTEPFLSRGSLHMLSDDQKIGWHPEFEERLAILLAGRASAK